MSRGFAPEAYFRLFKNVFKSLFRLSLIRVIWTRKATFLKIVNFPATKFSPGFYEKCDNKTSLKIESKSFLICTRMVSTLAIFLLFIKITTPQVEYVGFETNETFLLRFFRKWYQGLVMETKNMFFLRNLDPYEIPQKFSSFSSVVEAMLGVITVVALLAGSIVGVCSELLVLMYSLTLWSQVTHFITTLQSQYLASEENDDDENGHSKLKWQGNECKAEIASVISEYRSLQRLAKLLNGAMGDTLPFFIGECLFIYSINWHNFSLLEIDGVVRLYFYAILVSFLIVCCSISRQMQTMRTWVHEYEHSPILNCKEVTLLLDSTSKESVAIEIWGVVTINLSFIGTCLCVIFHFLGMALYITSLRSAIQNMSTGFAPEAYFRLFKNAFRFLFKLSVIRVIWTRKATFLKIINFPTTKLCPGSYEKCDNKASLKIESKSFLLIICVVSTLVVFLRFIEITSPQDEKIEFESNDAFLARFLRKWYQSLVMETKYLFFLRNDDPNRVPQKFWSFRNVVEVILEIITAVTLLSRGIVGVCSELLVLMYSLTLWSQVTKFITTLKSRYLAREENDDDENDAVSHSNLKWKGNECKAETSIVISEYRSLQRLAELLNGAMDDSLPFFIGECLFIYSINWHNFSLVEIDGIVRLYFYIILVSFLIICSSISRQMQTMRTWIHACEHSPILSCKEVTLLLDSISKESVAIEIWGVVTINFAFIGTLLLAVSVLKIIAIATYQVHTNCLIFFIVSPKIRCRILNSLYKIRVGFLYLSIVYWQLYSRCKPMRMKRVKREPSPGGTFPPFGNCPVCGTKYNGSLWHVEVYDVCGHRKCHDCALSQTRICEECEKEKEDEPYYWYPDDYPDYLKVTNGDFKRGEKAWMERIRRANPIFRTFKTIPTFIFDAATLYPLPEPPDAEEDSDGEPEESGEESTSSSAPVVNGYGNDDGEVAGPSRNMYSSTANIPSTSSSQLATDPEPEERFISVVDLRMITEEEDEEEEDDVSPPSALPLVASISSSRPPPRPLSYDPNSIKECYVSIRRLEEELRIVGSIGRNNNQNQIEVVTIKEESEELQIVPVNDRQSISRDDDNDSDVVVLPPVTRSRARQEYFMSRRILREKRGNLQGKSQTRMILPKPSTSTSSRARSIAKAKQQVLKRPAQIVRKPTLQKSASARSSMKTESLNSSQLKWRTPVTCHVCKKTLSNQGNLNRHLLVHTGVKKFECRPCQLLFSRQDKYRSHMLSQWHKDHLAMSKTMIEK
ncbi:unnamed protein product [Orchesella dallaii]|uniref:C2H2-type domain-containing protein n=1 Tax=Orchesella dallaii TaxID=48710 RepID=A0ABP1S9M1_9HEXA